MEAWLIGEEASPTTLRPGDMISLPAGTAHAFRNPGPEVLRLLGIHNNRPGSCIGSIRRMPRSR
jgi:mannose-6-phosphate isomerase-like protein (cupin superfamily)